MIEPSLDMMAGALFELIALARVDEYTEAGWRSETSSQHLKAQVDRSWLSKQLAQLDSAVHPPLSGLPSSWEGISIHFCLSMSEVAPFPQPSAGPGLPRASYEACGGLPLIQ